MESKKKTKRVLIFSVTYEPFVGGAEVAVREITERFRTQAKEYVFDMITIRFDKNLPEHERVGNVNIYRVGYGRFGANISDTYKFPLSLNKYLFPFVAYRMARKLHSEHFYDLIWSIQANYAGFAALFTKWALPHVPFLLTLQEGDPPKRYRNRVGPLLPLYEAIFRNANFVHAISHFLKDLARSMGYWGPLEVIPNGVDVERFLEGSNKSTPEQIELRLRKSRDETYIVTTSRLVKKNAVSDIIRCLTYLPETTKLLVLGDGPLGKRLWKLAKRLGVSKRVFFAGRVSQKDVPSYLAVSDIFVRPSLSEGQGVSFIEAMAAGLPVIATPVGGIPDFLHDPSTKLGGVTPTGLFCEVHNPASIAKQVERINGDEKLRERLVTNARLMVKEKYDWEKLVAEMKEKAFSKVLE